MSQKSLIPAADRLQFITIFTVLTILGWYVGTYLIRSLTVRITGTFFDSGLVQGLFIGIAQWIALRRYMPNKLWILATVIGWACSQALSGALLLRLEGATLAIGFICLGFSQWLIIRQFIKYDWIWILVPLVPAAIGFAVPSFGFSIGFFIRLIALGAIPAIALCLFRQKNCI
jgi:hypothetical protein